MKPRNAANCCCQKMPYTFYVFFNSYKGCSDSRRSFQPNRKIFKHEISSFIFIFWRQFWPAWIGIRTHWPIWIHIRNTVHRITGCCLCPPESRCCELADVRARLKQEEEERLALQAEERRRQEEAWHRHQQDRERRQASQSGSPNLFPYPVRVWIPPLN